MREAVVVAYGRTAVGKAPRGILSKTRPEEYAAQVVKAVVEKVPQLNPAEIEDLVLGCATPEAEQGFNMGRIVALRAGLPFDVSGQTVNRFCSSGLQAIATAANSIVAGQSDVMLAGGVETMSLLPMGGHNISPNPYLIANSDSYMSMGMTAERVAEKYGVTREMQDAMAVESHRRAGQAQSEGKFADEIIPVDAVKSTTNEKGFASNKTVLFNNDEGVRPGTTMEDLAKLKTVFKANGTVTAGTSSQMSDAAGIVLLMSREKAEALGIKPIAVFRMFAVSGLDPQYMGLGPIKAIPKALEKAGLTLKDIDLIELNEAFAAQAITCINELGLNKDIINVNGGALALGHPLGATGGILTCKLLSEMSRRKSKYGLVSMCIGVGMGATGIYEMC